MKTPKIDLTKSTGTYTKKGSKWVHTILDNAGNVLATRSTAGQEPYKFCFISDTGKAFEYRRENKAPGKFKGSIIPILDAAAIKDTQDFVNQMFSAGPSPVPAAKKAAALGKPVSEKHPATKDQLRILARDLPEGSMGLFKHWVDVNGVMGGDNVDTADLFPSPKSTIKKDEVHIAELVKRGLVKVQNYKDLSIKTTTVTLTHLGEQLSAYLEEVANPPTLVVDGTAERINATAPNKKPTPVPTAKRVPAPKFDRAAMRYDAIQLAMKAVKMDTWGKKDYGTMIKILETGYPLLYSKLKTPEKVHAYSVGILDFCLAACRKLDTRP